MSKIAAALFSRATHAILSEIFRHPEGVHLRALTQATGLGSASAQRELGRLTEAGLLLREPIGRVLRYRANPASPIHAELAAILRKTAGLADTVSSALTPYRDKIERAFIYGSVARETDTAGSDIDLLLVADDIGSAELYPALLDAEQALGRKISLTVYRPAEFAAKRARGNHFVSTVLQGPRIDLIGGEHEH